MTAPWLVLISLAGGVSLQAPARSAVEGMMHGEDIGGDLLRLPPDGLGEAFPEGLLHLADALFDRSVVFRVVGRAVEGDDPVFRQDAVDGGVV